MELEEGAKVKSAYQVALERFSEFDGVIRKPKDDDSSLSFDSAYDPSFFIKDDKSKHVENSLEPQTPQRKTSQKRSVDEDNIVPVEDLEDLTYPTLPPADSEEFEVKVHYAGPLFDYGGYAKMNRTFIFGLRDLGCFVKTHPIESITNVNKRTENALRSMSDVDLPNKYPKIFAMTVPDIIAHGGRKILYTMMETSHKVHKHYAERLNLADEIWTPTTWCKETFKNSNVYPEIRVMPLGVDTKRYKPGLEPINFGPKIRGFRFLSQSGWSYRKGFDVLIRAFLEEFSNKDDVTLILSTRFAGGLSQKSKDRLLSDFKYFRSLVKKKDNELPHIVLHSTYTPEAQMPNLYNSAHCFVLISRGEGWGLPYCEAASCGLPIIASDHGGQRDFLTKENSYLVEPTSYFVTKVQDPAFKNLAWISHFYEDQEFPDYEGEAFEQVKHHLRTVYEHYEEAQRKAEILREVMLSKYDWSHSINKVYDRLKEICNEVDRNKENQLPNN